MEFLHPVINKFRVLVVITDTTNIGQDQIDFIYNYASICCVSIECVILEELTDLTNILNSHNLTFNLLYFMGHGDIDGTIIGGELVNFNWCEIIPILNDSDRVASDCLLYLHSCYSYNATATILKDCTKVLTIISFKKPAHNVPGYTAFFTFLFNIIFRDKTYEEAVRIINETVYEDLHILEKKDIDKCL